MMKTELSETERADLALLGVSVPTGIAVKGSRWIFQMGDRDRLVDLLASDWFVSKVHLLPADVSPVAGDLAARLCRSVARTAVARAIRLADDWGAYADSLTARANVVAPMFDRPTVAESLPRPTVRQVLHASTHPMGYASWSMQTEHSGTTLLRNRNLPADRPDVWNATRRTHVTRPDVVAYRGQTRFARPAPCRYGRNGLQPACEFVPGQVWSVTTTGDISPAVDSWSHAELLTSITRTRTARIPAVIERRDDHGRLIGRRTEFTTVRLADDGTRYGFRGHHAITWSAAPRTSAKRRAARSAARAARIGATGARGPAVGPWSIAERSLPRAIAARGLTDVVAAIEQVIRTATDHSVIEFTDGTVCTVSGPGEVLTGDRAYGVRTFARRAALAGITA